MDEPDDVDRLRVALQRLYDGVARWSDSRWAGQVGDGRSRADVLFALVLDLAELGTRAGCGAPSAIRPHRLGSHALADQLAVVGAELVAAPQAELVAGQAEIAVATAHRLLLG